MLSNPQQRAVDRDQLAQAVTLLSDEIATHPISRSQQRYFHWFQLSFWGFWLFWASFLVFFEAVGEKPTDAHQIVIVPLILGMIGCYLSIFISLKWNWPVLRSAWAQFRLAQRTKTWGLLEPQWGHRRWPRRLLLGAAILVLAPVLYIHVAVSWVFGVLILVIIPPYLFLHTTRRRIRQIGLLQKLLQELQEKQSQSGDAAASFRISSGDFEKIAQLEDHRLLLRRARAIERARVEDPGYAILKSRAVDDAIAPLDSATQFGIELQLQKLAHDPRLGEVTGSQDASTRFCLPHTDVEVSYRVHQAERQLDIVALQVRPQEAGSGARKDGQHA